MAIFYHIDRLNQLNENTEINLKVWKDIAWDNNNNPDFLQNLIDEMFPTGVSSHGNQYFLNSSLFNDTSADIELTFELVRRYKYSDKLSRFEAFFAIDKPTLFQMLQRLRANPNNVSVFEVECDIYSKHDMNLLTKGSSLVNVALAELYWNGKALGNPLYEYLLKPPIKILKKISIT